MGRPIFTSDAARRLQIGVSTLRKYAALLEENGYRFERGTNNGRIFDEHDLQCISTMIDLLKENKGLFIEEAAEQAVHTHYRHRPKKQEEMNKDVNLLLERMEELEKQQDTLTEMNQTLVRKIQALTEKIEGRERDEQLFKLAEEARKRKGRKGIMILNPLSLLNGRR